VTTVASGAAWANLDPACRLELAPDPALLVTARVFAGAVARQEGCTEALIADLKLAVSEVATEILRSTTERIVLVVQPEAEGVVRVAIGPTTSASLKDARGEGVPPALELVGLLFPDARVEESDEPGSGYVRFTVGSETGPSELEHRD
jgi:hypothetical protein